MDSPLAELTKLADVFFNGRSAFPECRAQPAPERKASPKLDGATLLQLIERRTSVVQVGGKRYKITVEEA